MKHLLDTDVCIDLLRGRKSVVAEAMQHGPGDLAISAITRFELLFGVERCSPEWRKKESSKVQLLFENLVILPFTAETSTHAATIRAALESTGNPIGPMDILIAATAIEYNLPLVTNNLDEFQRVPGLACSTWCKK